MINLNVLLDFQKRVHKRLLDGHLLVWLPTFLSAGHPSDGIGQTSPVSKDSGSGQLLEVFSGFWIETLNLKAIQIFKDFEIQLNPSQRRRPMAMMMHR